MVLGLAGAPALFSVCSLIIVSLSKLVDRCGSSYALRKLMKGFPSVETILGREHQGKEHCGRRLFHPTLVRARARKPSTNLLAMENAKALVLPPAMDSVIKLVRTCRLAAGLVERPRLAEKFFRLVETRSPFLVHRSANQIPPPNPILPDYE